VKRSNRLLVLFGLLFALVGGGLAFVVASGPGGGGGTPAASATPTPEPTTTVVVAKQDINLGDRITADMLDLKTLKVSERAALGPDTFTTVAEVVGKVAGGKISTGEPLLGSRDFLSPGSVADGKDIAGAIASGYVGVAIELDQINGVGTLIVPGDRVNIILSVYVNQLALKNTVDDGVNKIDINLEGGKEVTTKMIIQNRKVVLTLLPPLTAAPTVAPVPNSSAEPIALPTTPIVRNDGRHMVAIIEVKPDEAEIISWAQREEKTDPQNYIDLSVALRSDQDNALPIFSTPGITYKMLVDKYNVLPPDPRAVIPADIAKKLTW
jgi:Flp pilus assembly protein CpaB